MKRSVFIRSGAVAAGLFGTLKSFPLSVTAEGNSPNPLQTPDLILKLPGFSQEDIRSADYLNRIRADKYLPKTPVFAKSSLGFCAVTRIFRKNLNS